MKIVRVGYLTTRAKQGIKEDICTALCNPMQGCHGLEQGTACDGYRRVKVTVTIEDARGRKR